MLKTDDLMRILAYNAISNRYASAIDAKDIDRAMGYYCPWILVKVSNRRNSEEVEGITACAILVHSSTALRYGFWPLSGMDS